MFLVTLIIETLLMADFGELFYKKFPEDIGDNVSTSVEFVLEICFVEW